MSLIVKETELDSVKLITPVTSFEDFRGDYVEIYNEKIYKSSGIEHTFVQDDYATSSKHVLRGIHGDKKTVKLVKCLHGSLYVVIVNNCQESPQYKKWTSFHLSSSNRQQILVPANFGVGYLVLSDTAIFHYKQTTYYPDPDAPQFTIKWNDPEYNIWWPIDNPIRSKRDY